MCRSYQIKLATRSNSEEKSGTRGGGAGEITCDNLRVSSRSGELKWRTTLVGSRPTSGVGSRARFGSRNKSRPGHGWYPEGIRKVSGWYSDGILAAASTSGSSAQERASATGSEVNRQLFRSLRHGLLVLLVLQHRAFAVVSRKYCGTGRMIFLWNHKLLIASQNLVAIQW